MDSAPFRIAFHADDLGMSRAVTDGILRGCRQGILTSTSILANGPDASRALWLWRGLAAERADGALPSAAIRRKLDDPDRAFDLGVHLNLTQGRPLSRDFPTELLDASGRFLGVFGLFARLRKAGKRFEAAIHAELEQQIKVVRDHGIHPTHVNGHQYIEMIPTVTQILLDLLGDDAIRSVRVPLEPSLFRSTVLWGLPTKWPLAVVKRMYAKRFRTKAEAMGLTHADAFFGTAHAGCVDLKLLRCFLAGAGAYKLVEVGLHPAEVADGISSADIASGWDDPLIQSRPRELQMLCSAELPSLLDRFGRRLGRLAAE